MAPNDNNQDNIAFTEPEPAIPASLSLTVVREEAPVEPKLLAPRDPKTVAIGELQGELRAGINNLDSLIYGFRRGLVTQQETAQVIDAIISSAYDIAEKLAVLPQDLA